MNLLGLKVVKISTLRQLQEMNPPQTDIRDIKADIEFMNLYEQVKCYTLVGIERSYALFKAVEYIVKNKIEGHLVECGVWKGGSCMLVALALQLLGDEKREIWLYDTFAGMTEPGNPDGEAEKKEWAAQRISDSRNAWCLANLEEVKENLYSTHYPNHLLHFIEGKVEDTIPAEIPSQIALLRLDTDWYASTIHELNHLYPLMSRQGIVIVDDYGAWQGARKAVDEYFKGSAFLARIDWTGRLMIKP